MTNTTDHNHTQQKSAFPIFIFPHSSHVFLKRSRRFDALAEGHMLAGWLSFLGQITRSQHRLLQEYPTLPLPDGAAMIFARESGLPPLPALSWSRDPFWRQALAALIRDLLPHAPSPARNTLARLQALDSASLETLADQVLRMEFDGQHVDFLPFVAAVLQVHWTALATKLDQTKITRLDMPGMCPCCGFLPVASVVHPDGEITNLRYLHCGLCNTEWHQARVTCAACCDSGSIAYLYIESDSDNGAVRAETCDVCRCYLKIIYREKSPLADPVADDLATLALDLLVEEAGYDRMSPNLLFAPGP